MLKILAAQNHELAQLATDSDTVLAPLARGPRQIAGFIVHANTTSVASAARAADISRSFQLFPYFLRQLRPLIADLGKLADQGTPLMASLAQSASALGRQFQNLAPFAAGGAAGADRARRIRRRVPAGAGRRRCRWRSGCASWARPAGRPRRGSAQLLGQPRQTGGIQQLMSLLFNGAGAANGFDSLGHYVRERTAGRRLHRLRRAAGAGLLGQLRPARRPRRARGSRARPPPAAAPAAPARRSAVRTAGGAAAAGRGAGGDGRAR